LIYVDYNFAVLPLEVHPKIFELGIQKSIFRLWTDSKNHKNRKNGIGKNSA